MDGSDIMRRIHAVALCILMIIFTVLLNGCTSRKEIVGLFEAFSHETNEEVPYVHGQTLMLDGMSLDFDLILEANSIDGFFHEVYVIQNDVVFFGYSTALGNQRSGRLWNIATLTIEDKAVNSVYCEEFCSENGADQRYVPNSNDHSKNRYLTANGFYYDHKIVLTDHIKLTEFDLRTGSALKYSTKDYQYPTMLDVEIVDYQTIIFSKNHSEKTFDINQGKQSSVVFNEMSKLEKEKNWDKKPLLSYLFDKVQIADDQIFIICRVMNWHGETHAVVYLYDFETNTCQYAFHHFMNDVITDNLYVVPRI